MPRGRFRGNNNYLRLLRGLTLLLALLAGPIAWGQDSANDNPTYRFDIPAQPLMQALRDFTAVSGHQVVVPSGNVSLYTSSTVSGILTAEQALIQLVENTGLRASQSTPGTFVIEEDALKFNPESSVLEHVIVIGSKTGATRQELGTSVGYFDAERIRYETIYNVEDIFDRTANASSGSATAGAYSIRGVSNTGVVTSLSNSNALSSILINQVAIGVSSGNYVRPSLFDAASAEVLRGPQSSLQGPNALIGSMFINYNRPNFDGYQGVLRAEAGELDTRRLALMQNVVLAEDTLAARLVLETRQSNGDIVNTTTGRDDVEREDEETIRLGLRWQPLRNEDLIFDLTYQYNKSDTNPTPFAVPPVGGGLFDREQPYNVNDEFPSDFDLISLEARWQVNDHWLFTSVTGASEFSLDARFDGDLTAFDLLTVDKYIVEEELFSQEFRLNYTSDRLSALLGFFYSDSDYKSGFSTKGAFPDGMGGFAPYMSKTDSREKIRQRALFGQLIWRPVDAWEITLGARFNNEKRDIGSFADNNGFVSDFSHKVSFDQFIPSLTISRNLNASTRVGANYSRGFKPGGVAFAVFLGQATPYDEEFIDNYELFLRHQSRDGRLLLNANIFYFDWSDQQVTTTLPGGVPDFDYAVVNAGKSRVIGAELEVEWQATERLNIFANVGYTDTEFEDFVVNGVDLAGTSFPQAPKVTASFGGRYVSDQGLFAAATYRYTDGSFSSVTAPTVTKTSPRNLLSGRLGYQREGWQVYIWGTNLLDDEYEVYLQDGPSFGLSGAFGEVGSPRTLGVGFQLDW